MKITFIHHSGFFVELERACLLFDYWKGELPGPADKPLFIFASHSHRDHFNPAVFDYGRRWRDARWILANDIFKSRVPEELRPSVTFAAPRREYAVRAGDAEITVETLRSTDAGCAFLVRAEGKTLYHAGDLHLWLWRESEEDDRRMREAFERAQEALRGRTVDAAFLPLDPRQEPEDRFPGLDYTARIADLRHIYPMHCWQKFSVIDALLADPCSEPYRGRICRIRKDGQTDEI